jgi:hypothetical protein
LIHKAGQNSQPNIRIWDAGEVCRDDIQRRGLPAFECRLLQVAGYGEGMETRQQARVCPYKCMLTHLANYGAVSHRMI